MQSHKCHAFCIYPNNSGHAKDGMFILCIYHSEDSLDFVMAPAMSLCICQTSGADPAVIKAMAEAAKKTSSDGHDSNSHLVDALAALQNHGHAEAKEEHHSGGLFGLFGH